MPYPTPTNPIGLPDTLDMPVCFGLKKEGRLGKVRIEIYIMKSG